MIQLQASMDSPDSIEVWAEYFWRPEKIEVRFFLKDPHHQVKLPSPLHTDSPRQDGLWRHTCFEVFAKKSDAPGYWEFNFSPNRAWNTYSFDRYRYPQPPRRSDDFELLDVSWENSCLVAELKSRLKDFVPGLNFCAVIELHNGRLCYLSARPAPGQPDFHWLEGMVLPVHPERSDS